MQRWSKLGLIYVPDARGESSRTYAQVPTPFPVSADSLRIFFGSRDESNRTLPAFVEVAAAQPTTVTRRQLQPVLSLGELGCFDDTGVMPSCLVRRGDEIWLYYTGWNTSLTVPYRNSIGLAVSDDGGTTFRRKFDGPILDRCAEEPHFCATPFVMYEGGRWRMWYLSCTGWTLVAGKPEPRYLIRQTESDDGVHWQRPGSIAIPYAHPEEAIARPWVVKDDQGYHMWYCFRSTTGYRDDIARSYRIGYATSSDGFSWQRRDKEVNLPGQNDAWDGQMQAYPAIIDIRGRRHMLYNGNRFGESGFGIALLAGAS